jgi:predicted PurR-regulated permease PerM
MTIDRDIAGYHDVAPGGPSQEERPRGPSLPELRALLGIVIAAVVIVALYAGKDVFIPITLAVVLSFILSPLVNLLQRWHLWRGVAVCLSVLCALGAIALVGTLIGSQAAAMGEQAPQYARTIEGKVHNLESYATTRLSGITSRLGINLPSGAPVQAAPAPAAQQADAAGPRNPEPRASAPATSPFAIARTLLGPLLGPLETTVIVFVVAIFVLMQKEDLRDRFVRLFGAHDLHRTTLALDDAGRRLSRYFLVQFCVNSSFGVVIGVGLWLIGVPSAAMWGVLAGMLRFVPYIGSFLAAIAPMALAAAIEPGWTSALEVAALFGVVEPLTGYALEPMLYGHSTGLSPISVIVAALFWTWLWGPVGLILSTPLTLCLVVTGRHVKAMEFFDILLGDRPALTPVEVFYQRLLANHVDAMLACARQVMEEATLIEFHDEVLIPSLRLAAQDHARGVMAPDRMAAIQHGLHVLVEDLGEGVEEDPVLEEGANKVLCVAGPGVFDAVVAALLRQILHLNGHPARILRDGRGEGADGARLAVLCCADAASSPVLRRAALRRLRKGLGDLPVAVGFWPGDAVPDPQEALAFATLAQAVGAVLTPSEDVGRPAQSPPNSVPAGPSAAAGPA